jgi:hypothetical protein
MQILAYRDGVFYGVRPWMRHCPYYSYTAGVVARISLPDEFWDELKAKQ